MDNIERYVALTEQAMKRLEKGEPEDPALLANIKALEKSMTHEDRFDAYVLLGLISPEEHNGRSKAEILDLTDALFRTLSEELDHMNRALAETHANLSITLHVLDPRSPPRSPSCH